LSKKQVVMQKIAGICGIIAPIIALSFIALAISYSLSWFSWTNNALSDLGGPPPATATAAVLFNSGLIIGGILGMMFAVGLMYNMRKQIESIGTFILFLAIVSLIAVGVFPETAGHIHLYVSVAFFALFPISLFFIGAPMTREPTERCLGFVTLLLGVFAIISAAPIVLVSVDDVGIHELLAVLSGSAWAIVFGVKLYKQSNLN